MSGLTMQQLVAEDRRFGNSTPARSLEQRMAALKAGNVIRTRRAELKRDIKAGRADVIDTLLSPPTWAETMKVHDLLVAVPKFGRVKVNKILVRAAVSPSKTLGGMTVRQRSEIAGLVRR